MDESVQAAAREQPTSPLAAAPLAPPRQRRRRVPTRANGARSPSIRTRRTRASRPTAGFSCRAVCFARRKHMPIVIEELTAQVPSKLATMSAAESGRRTVMRLPRQRWNCSPWRTSGSNALPSTNPNAPLLSVRPRLRIDGQDRANLGEAALTLELRLPRSGMASAELRLLNWSGAGSRRTSSFRTSGLASASTSCSAKRRRAPRSAARSRPSKNITAAARRSSCCSPRTRCTNLRAGAAAAPRENESLDDVIRRIAGDAGLSANMQVVGKHHLAAEQRERPGVSAASARAARHRPAPARRSPARARQKPTATR